MLDIAELLRHADAVEKELDRLDCEERLLPFVRRHWKVLEPTIPLVEGWPLEAICEHLEAITNGEIRKLLINVPPGFMKSLLTDVFWPAWEWGPKGLSHLRYVTFAYAATLTERDNGRFRDLILSPEYQELWGHKFKLTKVGETKVANNHTGWKFASSVQGVGTGERGNRVIIDDPHNVVEGESEAVRGETVRWFRESIQNRLNDVTRDAIIVIMQRVHETDVSGEILTLGMDYEHLMIPMEWDGRSYSTSIGWTDPRSALDLDGDLAWPTRFPQESVNNLKRDLGQYGYAAQYQQVPSPRGGGIIKRDWWMPWTPKEARRHGVPEGRFPSFEFVIASLDTAYTEKQENDYSALTLWGVWTDRLGNDRLMLVYAWRDRLSMPDLVRKVLTICRTYNVDRLLIEAKAAGISTAQEIRRLMVEDSRARDARSMLPDFGFGIELINPKGTDKVNRVIAVAALFEEGLIYAPGFDDGTWVDWADMTISECATFPKGAHDDLVDSMSQGIRFLRNVGIAKRPIEKKTEIAERMKYKARGSSGPLYPV